MNLTKIMLLKPNVSLFYNTFICFWDTVNYVIRVKYEITKFMSLRRSVGYWLKLVYDIFYILNYSILSHLTSFLDIVTFLRRSIKLAKFNGEI